ncbi:lysostaphin resistance A-like protein [Ilumatobacter sp.]|uniref:CPBP family intramembrane glutamic endopeptidase n=1 Tax=Ilumatobacter sp. TaxID=1967498 RepID=UPI003C35B5FC
MTSSPPPWGPPTTPIGQPAFVTTATPAHPTLPLAPGIGALVVLAASLVASKYLLDLVVDFEWPVAVYVALLAVAGYGPSVAWWWYATDRWGSGRRLDDVGARPRWTDLAWGPLIWICTVVVQTVIGVVVLALDVPVTNNTDDLGELASDRTYAVAIIITAVVAAPLVEELVFRGIVMRSLCSTMPGVAAVVVQGVLFGIVHVDPVRGAGNLGLVLILSGVGISFGTAAYLLRRIGPTIVAHAIFNGVVMLLLLSGVRDRIIEDNPDLFDGRAATSVVERRSAAEEVAVVDQADITEPDGRRDPRTCV